jgi:hypothetical protein
MTKIAYFSRHAQKITDLNLKVGCGYVIQTKRLLFIAAIVMLIQYIFVSLKY